MEARETKWGDWKPSWCQMKDVVLPWWRSRRMGGSFWNEAVASSVPHKCFFCALRMQFESAIK